MHNANTAYIAIWPGLLPVSLRTYDAPTDASMKYGNIKDPIKKAERLREAQESWASDESLATKAEYGFVRAIGVRLNGVNSVFMGGPSDEARTLEKASHLAHRAETVGVMTAWTSQFLRFRCLAAWQPVSLPYVSMADRYFGVLTVPEMRTVGHALQSQQHEDLLPYGASPASDEQVTSHLSAALLLLQHMNMSPYDGRPFRLPEDELGGDLWQTDEERKAARRALLDAERSKARAEITP